MQHRGLLVFFSLLIAFSSSAQSPYATSPYPNNYFASPIKTDIRLAGNFGEIRPNHLHAGFDIKTNGKEGMPIYAIADGYVSRLKISSRGYGKALYIDHPNGYTSVYAHLQSFHGDIGRETKRIQYAIESFPLDTLLQTPYLKVRKGDLIGISGNTGSSMGPHLHFEIRDTKSENPINPYYFGYRVDDKVKPRITKVGIYPVGKNATVNGKHKPKVIKAYLNSVGYSFGKADTVTVNGEIGFGVDCYDTESSSPNHNGVFSIEMQVGGRRVFYAELERFSFDNSRYVNAYIDYAERKKRRTRIQKCYLVKNNELGICKESLNRGVVKFTDDTIHWVKFIVKDFLGNAATMLLKVKSTSVEKVNPKADTIGELYFDCLRPNNYKDEEIEIVLPDSCLYEDIHFKVKKWVRIKWTYSKLMRVQTTKVAAQKKFLLGIKAVNLPADLESKALIISVDGNDKRHYVGGDFIDGWVRAETKNFGNFAISVDTKAPYLKPNFKVVDKYNVNFRGAKSIGIKVSDNLSGINTYRAEIDGKWVLCEYEVKKRLLFYLFDDAILPGKHTFKIEVSDKKNNVKIWECGFVR